MAEQKCIFCKRESRVITHQYNTEYICEYCGIFCIDIDINIDLISLACMYYHILNNELYNSDDNNKIFFGDCGVQRKHKNHVFISKEVLIATYPKTFMQRMDMALLSLSRLYDGLGREVEPYTPHHFPSCEIENELRLAFFISHDIGTRKCKLDICGVLFFLYEIGYLTAINDVVAQHDGFPIYKISAKGWLRIQELEENHQVVPQAFIAMWFDSNGTMDLARNKIKEAIITSGYAPVIIDEKQHNNQIVPEIFYEIKQSTFIVADLTKHRNGVYYEAGYAQALDKEVIVTCRKDEFTARKVHFDIAQKNAIVWKNEDELYDKLLKRIEVTVKRK